MADSLKAIPIESLPSASSIESDDQLIAYRAGDNQAYRATVSKVAEGLNGNLSDAFSTLVSYAVGDYCIYNDTLYKCTKAHSGAWSDSDFEAVTVAEELSELNTNIANLNSLSQYAFDTNSDIVDQIESLGLEYKTVLMAYSPTDSIGAPSSTSGYNLIIFYWSAAIAKIIAISPSDNVIYSRNKLNNAWSNNWTQWSIT